MQATADADLLETSTYDEASDTLHVRTAYDNRQVMANNLAERNAAPEFGRYLGERLVKVCTIHLGDVQLLKNLGYNLLSPDPDEVKRALLYVQSEHKAMLSMPGTPIAKRRKVWV